MEPLQQMIERQMGQLMLANLNLAHQLAAKDARIAELEERVRALESQSDVRP